MEDKESSSLFPLLITELDKLNRRLDTIENKVNDIHATHERIKKEASFKRSYRETPLYGASHYSLSDFHPIASEDSDSGVDVPDGALDHMEVEGHSDLGRMRKKQCCQCCSTQ